MNEHFNQLTPAEDERLALLTEEAAEVIQAVSKIQRHGYESRWPKPDGTTNRQKLEAEVGHLLAAIDLILTDLDLKSVKTCQLEKHVYVKQFLHHQEYLPTVTSL